MDSKAFINHIVSNMNDEQADKLAALLSFSHIPASVTDLLKWCDVETNSIDTSFPIDYVREIEKIYPASTNARYVYDYRTAVFGSLLNVNDVFSDALLCYLKSIKY